MGFIILKAQFVHDLLERFVPHGEVFHVEMAFEESGDGLLPLFFGQGFVCVRLKDLGEEGRDGEVGLVTNCGEALQFIPVVRICTCAKFRDYDAACQLAGMFHPAEFVTTLWHRWAAVWRLSGAVFIVICGRCTVHRIVPVIFLW